MDGGGTFRARFGVEREEKLADGTAEGQSPGQRLLLEGLRDPGRLSRVHYGVLKKLGWDGDLTEAERATIEKIGGANPDGVSWSTDLSAASSASACRCMAA
jgi:formate dehydrogenase major subunit